MEYNFFAWFRKYFHPNGNLYSRYIFVIDFWSSLISACHSRLLTEYCLLQEYIYISTAAVRCGTMTFSWNVNENFSWGKFTINVYLLLICSCNHQINFYRKFQYFLTLLLHPVLFYYSFWLNRLWIKIIFVISS